MRRRKILVLFTCALFFAGVLSLGLYRAILSPKPIVISAKEHPALGREDAQVEMVVFEDFLCHTCRYFSMEVFPAVQATYIDKGLVRCLMVPLAFSQLSNKIANAALSVFYQAPDSYFLFIQAFFLRYSDMKRLEIKDLVELASEIEGIDLIDFENSVRTGRFDSQLAHNLKVAKKAMKKNLRTPAVFINGFPIPGISFQSLSEQIESTLKTQTARSI